MSKTLLAKNKVVIASAGSRKTTSLVEAALAVRDGNVLLTTYTTENVDQICAYLVKRKGFIPKNITILSWFGFLLQDGVRPYQNHITARGRIPTINFTAAPDRYTPKTNADKYFLTANDAIYRDRVSDFICSCDDRSGGLVVRRLEKIYETIFIDELQDFAGYDLTFLEKLFNSTISVIAVGDPRQATFSTNNSAKNSRFKKRNIVEWINDGKAKNLFTVEERAECYRSNQAICDFADALFPTLPKTISKNIEVTGHDGVFCIGSSEVADYVSLRQPVVLRHNKTTDTMSLPALNIGLTKGRTYDRVLIFPTEPMKKYLRSKKLGDAGDLAKLYVGVTRAKYSSTFVV